MIIAQIDDTMDAQCPMDDIHSTLSRALSNACVCVAGHVVMQRSLSAQFSKGLALELPVAYMRRILVIQTTYLCLWALFTK